MMMLMISTGAMSKTNGTFTFLHDEDGTKEEKENSTCHCAFAFNCRHPLDSPIMNDKCRSNKSEKKNYISNCNKLT